MNSFYLVFSWKYLRKFTRYLNDSEVLRISIFYAVGYSILVLNLGLIWNALKQTFNDPYIRHQQERVNLNQYYGYFKTLLTNPIRKNNIYFCNTDVNYTREFMVYKSLFKIQNFAYNFKRTPVSINSAYIDHWWTRIV